MSDPDRRERSSDEDWNAIARYLAGESSPEEASRVRQALSERPDGGRSIVALDELLRQSAALPPSPGEVEAALASVLARRDAPESRGHATARPAGRAWSRGVVRAAAIVVTVAAALTLWRSVGRRSDSSASIHRATGGETRHETAVGRLDSLRLPDGTRVVLGPASELVLAPRYGSERRLVTLRGEALFHVAHDASHPFVVRTSSAEVRDVGTIFVVAHSEERTRVSVVEGAVAIRPASTTVAEVVLQEGDRASVVTSGALDVERGVETSDDLAWTQSRLVLRDATIADAGRELRRWFGIELRVSDSAIAARRVTATFDASGGAGVERVLAAMLGSAARRMGDTIWLAPATRPRAPR